MSDLLRMTAIACLFASPLGAQELPPRDLIEKIIPQLQAPLPPARISFRAIPGKAEPACNMQSFEMTLSRDDAKAPNRYSVLIDPQSGADPVPRQMLAVIDRLAVDADGAARAYHPLDIWGKGVCERHSVGSQEKMKGICALDSFRSSGIRVFRSAERVRFPDPRRNLEQAKSDSDLWMEIWPKIRDRTLPAIDLKAFAGARAPEDYRMFYWKERGAFAFFRQAIIPWTRDGYPCLRDDRDRAPGYFISATTLTRAGEVRADGCAPSRYIDALETPFFVLPGGAVGNVGIGDVVIGFYKSGRTERLAFGVAADAGPIAQFGEGSIAFNQILLGKSGKPVMNIDDVNALDIDSDKLKSDGATLAILVLGGTKAKLNGDYSRENLEKVGRAELSRWNGSGSLTSRLGACVRQTRP